MQIAVEEKLTEPDKKNIISQEGILPAEKVKLKSVRRIKSVAGLMNKVSQYS